MPTTRVVVQIPGEEAYDVRIGEGLLDALGARLVANGTIASGSRVLVLTDSNVAPLYLPRAKASLAGAGLVVDDITIPAGEASKCLGIAGEVWEAMASLKLGRDCTVIALGGGVVGDIAGFVGSAYMRGVPIVQVPTTLLAMVDSSVGGKTGVNLEAGKNLVGTFAQPAAVCASVDALATLDEREWRCGLGEVAKSAVLDSDEFFFWLQDGAARMAERDPGVVSEAISRCVVFKANVVAEDKTESRGVRECLNLGHTLAHAIETLSGYGTFSHGEAVAEGMRFALQLSRALVGASEEFISAVEGLLDSLGLFPLDWNAPVEEMLDCMKGDKKVREGRLRFVLMSDVACWELVEVDDDVVLAALRERFEGR